MTYFLRNGSNFTIAREENLDLHKELPPKNFVIKVNPANDTLYLEQVDSFPAPGKIYGNSTRHAARIMSTFAARSASTGVLLVGEKGSGKTMLAKQLSILGAAEQNMPTIVINTPYKDDKFNQLIQQITQPCIVLFDEFEKVYDRHEQEAILTLLDGVFPSKKLFVLTCNDEYRVDSHMRNRPGRIFYMLQFRGLDSDFITEYCKDNLSNKTYIPNVCKLSLLFSEFNFDMLKALVEEMNRYDETPAQAMEMLNAKPSADQDGSYTVKLFIENKEVPITSETWSGNPLNLEDSFTLCEKDGSSTKSGFRSPRRRSPPGRSDLTIEPSDDHEAGMNHFFSLNDLKNVNTMTGSITFVNVRGECAVFTKLVRSYDYHTVYMAA